MNKIKIINDNKYITTNFKMSEFWRPTYFGQVDFEIPECLVLGAQLLREYFGPTKITSTIRVKDTFGYHKTGNAIDLIPLENTIVNIAEFVYECKQYQLHKDNNWYHLTMPSNIIIKLRQLGIEGFGLENNNCIHLDYRAGLNCASKDRYGSYIVFEWHRDNSSTGKSNVIH